MSLPPVIQDLIGIIGHGHTMALVREFGGRDLRVPRAEGNDVWAALVEVIGEPATRKLAAAIGIEREIYIAKCERALKHDRNRKLIARYEKLLRDGESGRGAVFILAGEFKLSNRTVENIVNSPLPEPSTVATQGQLF